MAINFSECIICCELPASHNKRTVDICSDTKTPKENCQNCYPGLLCKKTIMKSNKCSATINQRLHVIHLKTC
jgi:hypothetical protein